MAVLLLQFFCGSFSVADSYGSFAVFQFFSGYFLVVSLWNLLCHSFSILNSHLHLSSLQFRCWFSLRQLLQK